MSEKQHKSGLQRLTIIGAIVTMAIAIAIYTMEYLKESGGGDVDAWFVYFKDLIPIVWNLVAILFVTMLLRVYGMKSAPGRVWILFILGLVAWFFGEFIWFWDEAVQGIESPFPSPADYLYIVGYFFFILGITFQLRQTKADIGKKDLQKIILFAVVLSLITIIFVIGPIIVDIIGTEYAIDEEIISFAYPILDIVLGTSAITLVLRFKGGKFSIAWLLIGIAFILMVAFDLVFTWINYSEVYSLYYIIDHVYNSFYLLFAIGAAYFLSTIEEI